MTRRDEQRAATLEKIAMHVLTHGLEKASLRQMAAAAGISDRMLLYYFADKNDLITAVLMRIAQDLALVLDRDVPTVPRQTPSALFAKAITLTRSPELRPYMQISADIAARAARGEAPYPDITSGIIAGFRMWLEVRLDIEDSEARRDMAALILTFVDGSSLIDLGARDDTADRATKLLLSLL